MPQVDPADWSLRIHGLVANEVTITWDELLALPLEESVTTLTCVSNEVGGELIGNALWLGYPIRELLARAAPHRRCRHGAVALDRRLHRQLRRSRRSPTTATRSSRSA